MSTRQILIIRLAATGDVVRTTPLITALSSDVTWITADKNEILFTGTNGLIRCVPWSKREKVADRTYDLVVNLEDAAEVASFARTVVSEEVCGAHLNSIGGVTYTDDFRNWFDLSIISRHGKQKADCLKFRNRQTYQELVFKGAGLKFAGEPYLLPEPIDTGLAGGDTLPMHFALGTGARCVPVFTCTSPWEIYDYGLQTESFHLC